MKKTIKRLLILLILILFIFVAYRFLLSPVSAKIMTVEYHRLDTDVKPGDGQNAEDYLDRVWRNFYGLPTNEYGQQALSNFNVLPSDNPHDYITIKYYISVTNPTIFDMKAEIKISDTNGVNDFFLYRALEPVPYALDGIPRRPTKDVWEITLAAYVGDLSDEDIEDIIKNITIDISYNGGIIKECTVSVSPAKKCDVLLITE